MNRCPATDSQLTDNPAPITLKAHQHVLIVHGFPSQAIQKTQQIRAVGTIRPFPVFFGQGPIPGHVNLVKRLARQNSILFAR